MKTIQILPVLLAIFIICTTPLTAQQYSLASPDNKLLVEINTGSNERSLMTYAFLTKSKERLINGIIGINTGPSASNKESSNPAPQNTVYYAGKPLKKSVSRSWTALYGERKIVPENYREIIFRFETRGQSPDSIIVICRLYNEGFAYRYRVYKRGDFTIQTEQSMFETLPGSIAWSSRFAQSPISQIPVRQLADTVERPLTIQIPNSKYLALGEAALTDFARMKFAGTRSDSLGCVLGSAIEATNTILSPWRYILIGDSPAALLGRNYLLENLNEPSAIGKDNWIKPGKILREVTLSTQGAINSIDFASRHNISYICFDAGWYGKEDSDTSDASRVSLDPARAKGSLDLQKVIAYGRTHGVRVFLYVNRRALERQIDTLFPLYESWGIKGIKFGFVQVGSQVVTSWLHSAVTKAAKYHLLVDIHDEYRPTGLSRTYPNLLTQEGIRGDEESPVLEHTIKTIFTRMIAGAADNTICYFNERVDKMGSHTAQLAKAVCLYSPLQFLYWYDRPLPDTSTDLRPGIIRQTAELDWFDQLPVVWDETRIIEGTMDGYVTIARRAGKNWFVGSLNGVTERKLNLALRFLKTGARYTATIYTDDQALNSPTRVRKRERKVSSDTNLQFDILSRNAVAIRITEIPAD
ncbi:glycoside hydrolase family 97 protein [Flavitalea antarctica]